MVTDDRGKSRMHHLLLCLHFPSQRIILKLEKVRTAREREFQAKAGEHIRKHPALQCNFTSPVLLREFEMCPTLLGTGEVPEDWRWTNVLIC